MKDQKINLGFTNYTKQKIPSRYFLFVLKDFLNKLDISNNIEVNLILVGKTRIRKLNKEFRKKDKATDVLSFPIDILNIKDIVKNKDIVLGDIFICPQMVKIAEMEKIFLHGLMHLVGYDHISSKQEVEWKKIDSQTGLETI